MNVSFIRWSRAIDSYKRAIDSYKAFAWLEIEAFRFDEIDRLSASNGWSRAIQGRLYLKGVCPDLAEDRDCADLVLKFGKYTWTKLPGGIKMT